MTPEQIEALVAGGESETLEFKRTTGELRTGTRTLCGMLNHRGGNVLYGIDENRRVLGQQVSHRTLEDLSQEVAAIDPPVFPTVQRIPLGGGREVLSVTAGAGQGRPYSYRGQAYRRVGNTTVQLSRDEYNRMLLERVHGETRWENERADDWSIADLDHGEIRKTLEEAIRRGRMEDPGTRDIEGILRGLGLFRGGALLRAAVVLFGRSERVATELPQCLLRVARFAGNDKTEFRDNRQVRGDAFDLLLAAERFLAQHVPVAGRVIAERFERVDEPLYPPVAVREALANAICHRDYSIGGGSVGVAMYDDRLEVTSSGSLHFGLTPDALFQPHESLPWNPLIANVFYRRGIIESWGRGTLKMAEIAASAGLPRPDIEDAGGCVTVRFRPMGYVPPQRVARNVTERQRRILSYLAASSGGAALREIVAGLDLASTPWVVQEDLATLKNLGLVQTFGWGRGAKWELTG